VNAKRRQPIPRAKLTSERIIAAALEISDSPDGLDAVTVRSLASELGVGTMTLYGYFRSKDEILDAMADHVMGGMHMPSVAGETPAQALRAVASALLDVMTEHPSVASLLASRVTRSQRSLRGAMESVLQRMVDAGIPGPVAVRCYGVLIHHAMGFASYRAPRPWGGDPGPEVNELRRQQQHFYAALPVQDFPLIVDLASELVVLPSREVFDFAVDALVAQVEGSIS
jgi:AcrR family transcriptional regulator